MFYIFLASRAFSNLWFIFKTVLETSNFDKNCANFHHPSTLWKKERKKTFFFKIWLFSLLQLFPVLLLLQLLLGLLHHRHSENDCSCPKSYFFFFLNNSHLMLLIPNTLWRCQFHQHFYDQLLRTKVLLWAEFLPTYTLRLYVFVAERKLLKKQHVKCWWNWLLCLTWARVCDDGHNNKEDNIIDNVSGVNNITTTELTKQYRRRRINNVVDVGVDVFINNK